MGYCISVNLSDVRILKKNEKKFFEIMKKLAKDGGRYGRGFSWVGPEFAIETTVDGALDHWRYKAKYDLASETWVVEYFQGEKMGDDDALWTALAPIVEDGAVIHFKGEDAAQWKYIFAKGKMTEKRGRVSFE